MEVRRNEMEQEKIRFIKSEGCRGEHVRKKRHEDIHLLSVNLFSEMFFGSRTVNWVIVADCQRSGVFIPFI